MNLYDLHWPLPGRPPVIPTFLVWQGSGLAKSWDRWFARNRESLGIALIRILCGLYFFSNGWEKYHQVDFALTLPSVFDGWADQNPFFLVEDLLKFVAAPQSRWLAPLLVNMELALGGMMMAGLLMRWVPKLALVWAIGYYLATQHLSVMHHFLTIGLMGVTLALLWMDAGHHFGLDQLMDEVKAFIRARREDPDLQPRKRKRSSNSKPVRRTGSSRFQPVATADSRDLIDSLKKAKKASRKVIPLAVADYDPYTSEEDADDDDEDDD
ncbi:MAG: hypothetical protein AB7P76_07590 [Candidatus Melainabacteria bacterium]